MSTIPPRLPDAAPAETADDASEPEFKPLTAQEAREWRERHPPASPWRTIGLQAVVGVLAMLVAWLLTRQARVVWSVGYGVLAVVVPAALFARGLARQLAVGQPGAAFAGLLVWELVKVVLTVAMLFVAPRVVVDLSWLALLAGFVVTMKVYWVALWLRPGRKDSGKKI